MIAKSFFMFHDPSIKLVHTQFTISFNFCLAKVKLLLYNDSSSQFQGTWQQNAPFKNVYFLFFFFFFLEINAPTDSLDFALVRLAQKIRTKKPITVQPKNRFRKKTDIEFFMPLIAAIIKGIKYKAIIMINANASIKIYTIFLNLIQGTWQRNAPTHFQSGDKVLVNFRFRNLNSQQ